MFHTNINFSQYTGDRRDTSLVNDLLAEQGINETARSLQDSGTPIARMLNEAALVLAVAHLDAIRAQNTLAQTMNDNLRVGRVQDLGRSGLSDGLQRLEGRIDGVGRLFEMAVREYKREQGQDN